MGRLSDRGKVLRLLSSPTGSLTDWKVWDLLPSMGHCALFGHPD